MKRKYMHFVAGADQQGGGGGPKDPKGNAGDDLIKEAAKGTTGADQQGQEKQAGEDIKEPTAQEKFDEMLRSEEGKLVIEHVANRAVSILTEKSEDFLNDISKNVIENLKANGYVVKVEGNAPGPVAPAKAEVPLLSDHEAKIKKFGKDYVDAKKGDLTKTFTKTAWNNMQVDAKATTRSGWARVVATPPELEQK